MKMKSRKYWPIEQPWIFLKISGLNQHRMLEESESNYMGTGRLVLSFDGNVTDFTQIDISRFVTEQDLGFWRNSLQI